MSYKDMGDDDMRMPTREEVRRWREQQRSGGYGDHAPSSGGTGHCMACTAWTGVNYVNGRPVCSRCLG